MLTTLKVYKEYIVIRILEIKKLYFSKSVRLELRILVQKVGVTTNYNKYKKQAQVIEHYDQSKENERMKKVGDIVILDKKIAYEVISINSIHYEFVDLVVEYTVQMVVPWSEQEINKALKEERKSTFKVLEGGK
ncbi:MAG: hypothetical protein E7B72_04110 [Enterococcus faecalis]|nr:hypothetical protein [Enterococcus faecalis]